MARFFIFAALLLVGYVNAAEPEVTDIRAIYRDGQTFVNWTDAAEGEAKRTGQRD